MSPNVAPVPLGPAAGRLPLVYSYLARAGDGWMAIDAGPPGSAGLIRAAMKRHGVPENSLRLILLTHGHFDHYGGALELRALLPGRVPIAAHPADRPFLAGAAPVRLRPTCWQGGPPLLFGAAHYYGLRGLRRLPAWADDALDEVIWLEGLDRDAPSDLRSLCGIEAAAIHTPGHSPGSICVRLPGGETFTGDLVSRTPGGAPAWPLLADEPGELRRSLCALAGVAPAVLYPGHGKPLDGRRYGDWAAGVRPPSP
jgi:glyoxylase-like metal-dependent hydrolase (beta-lactamase superfamily II)